MSLTIYPIAHIFNGFEQKFGIPRQAGLAKNVLSKIIFEPQFRNPDFIRDLEKNSHIWLIWEFSKFTGKEITPLVRPPRLGGNKKTGVFATRSPLRPNSLGMSAVKIEKIFIDKTSGPVIEVSGSDILSGTPIYDIKPYIKYSDCIPQAESIFFPKPQILDNVVFECELPLKENNKKILAVKEILYQDPRPAYKKTSKEIYKFEFENLHIEFFVENNTAKVVKCAVI